MCVIQFQSYTQRGGRQKTVQNKSSAVSQSSSSKERWVKQCPELRWNSTIGKVSVLIVIGHIASRLPYITQDNHDPDKKYRVYIRMNMAVGLDEMRISHESYTNTILLDVVMTKLSSGQWLQMAQSGFHQVGRLSGTTPSTPLHPLRAFLAGV